MEPASPVVADLDLDAAASLFGGRGAKPPAVGNYQLKGIVLASDASQSVAVIVENGKPARTMRAGSELAPGVFIKEVSREYILLKEGGAVTRIELPKNKLPAIGGEIDTVQIASPPKPASPDKKSVVQAVNKTDRVSPNDAR